MDVVNRAIVDDGKHSVAGIAGIDESGGGVHESRGVAARSKCRLPPTFRGPNEHDDGPQNEERESCRTDAKHSFHSILSLVSIL